MAYPRLIILIICLLMVLAGCRTNSVIDQPATEKKTADNKYDSEFPDRAVAGELEFISGTVKKLDCLVFYKTYIFSRESGMEVQKLTDSLLEAKAAGSTVINESVTGTAVVAYYDGTRVAMITCAHVIDFPDTLMTKYDGDGPLETLSVKIRQQNFVKDLPEGDDIEVLLVDTEKDIALLGKRLDEHTGRPSVLNYPIGNTRDLEWGSVVYVMGYPLGQLMATRAIVSNPDKANRGRFLTDALYNRGISGSPVLAIRDGVPNFEWVGMAASSAASRIYFVKPGKKDPDYINPEEKYTGELFVDQHRSINYGVTYNVSIEAITSLIRKNASRLADRGYNPEQFFK